MCIVICRLKSSAIFIIIVHLLSETQVKGGDVQLARNQVLKIR